ncbi:MAG: substrate-binding domain-containing protein [Janthinobacterium lividum]
MKKATEKSTSASNKERPAVDYGRLRNTLKEKLERQYRGGDRIPSERSLATEFNVSPATISRTLQDLAKAGIVHRKRGSGTYLCDPAAPASAAALSSPSLPPETSLSGRTIGIIAGIGDTPPLPGEPERVGHRIASAIEREIQSYGGRTQIVDTQRHLHGSERTLVAEMLRKGADSLVLIDQGSETARWLAPMLEARQRLPNDLPLVLALINDVCEWPVDCVRIDDAWGVFEATTHLFRQGHRRLAFLSPTQRYFSWADARAAAFRRAISLWNDVNTLAVCGTVLYGPEKYCSSELGCQWTPTCQALAEEFLQMDGITGVVAANDNIALQFMSVIKAKGVRVPEDVSIIGYDNIIEAASANLCTLDLPAEQMGVQTARLCRQRLENPIKDIRLEMALKPILLLRASVRSFL